MEQDDPAYLISPMFTRKQTFKNRSISHLPKSINLIKTEGQSPEPLNLPYINSN